MNKYYIVTIISVMLEEDSVVSYINGKLHVARILFSVFSLNNTFNLY